MNILLVTNGPGDDLNNENKLHRCTYSIGAVDTIQKLVCVIIFEPKTNITSLNVTHYWLMVYTNDERV